MPATGNSNQNVIVFFLVIWTILNLLNAAGAGLAHDEAYYWVYSQFPAWGYFDHPPAIALWIRAGTQLMHHELGVRLLTVFSSTATVIVLYHICRPRDVILFIVLLVSIFIVHAGGFIAVPDIPFVLFAAAYLYVFKTYLEEQSWLLTFLLGIFAAAMLYSKYHGILIIGLSILPNWKLLANPRIWIAGIIGVLLFSPHLIWQFQQDFPSFRYHLFERGSGAYKLRFTAEYLIGQCVIFGPLVSFLLPFAMAKNGRRDAFLRTCKWIVIGTFIFFLISSFRGRVEANWTIGAFPAMFCWAYPGFQDPVLRKWLFILAIPSLLFCFFFRTTTVWDFMPRDFWAKNEFHGWDNWAETIYTIAGDRPVIFRNNYRYPSKYMFYSEGISSSINDEAYKGNQFDYLYSLEKKLSGRPALFVAHDFEPYLQVPGDTMEIENEDYLIFEMDEVMSFNRLRMDVLRNTHNVRAGGHLQCTLSIHNPTNDTITMPVDDQLEYYIFYRGNDGTGAKRYIDDVHFQSIGPGETILQKVVAPAPELPGIYQYRVGINWHCIGGKNSFQYQLEVPE